MDFSDHLDHKFNIQIQVINYKLVNSIMLCNIYIYIYMHIYIHTFIHKCIYIDIHFYKLKNSKNYGNKLFKKVKFLKR